ncbi:hypothetical protein SZMC14600_05641 [Saccharomonospora azurea SZMC 14600]|uniref:DUF5336 domain-containing protein n=1 Tax=Saccharomonospora azurea TaxID=40988 RepID=UPI00023FF36C|nr:DUF5336 domain-containing protein [Saccharomonospora azurea]EHK88370.1 hypothetical protein SZMC14600_05641 [Saccharomonospora azurea SZMC 14600]
MTFPSGTPGGFPGQGPQQPHQPYPGPPSAGRPALPLPKILLLATGGLGVVNLFLAFANVGGRASFYEAGLGWVPALLFIAGAVAAISFLPGEEKPGAWPALLSLGTMLAFLFTVFQLGDLAVGGILVLILGLAQAGVAVTAYLLEAGIIKPSTGQPQPYGQSFPQTGGFGQPGQPGQFGGVPQSPQAPQQPGQPGSSSEGSGGFAAPTKFAQPVQPQQQATTYAPQHGQFFQPSGDAGQQSGQSGQPGQSSQSSQPGQPGQSGQPGQGGQTGSQGGSSS